MNGDKEIMGMLMCCIFWCGMCVFLIKMGAGLI